MSIVQNNLVPLNVLSKSESTGSVANRPAFKQQTVRSEEDEFVKQKKAEKNRKLKNGIITGVSLTSAIAIIALAVMSIKSMSGSKADQQVIDTLKEALPKIKDPGIKREIMEELSRNPYERNLLRAQELLQLGQLSEKNEIMTKANITEVKQKLDNEVIGMDKAKEKVIDYLKSINDNIEYGIDSKEPVVILFDGPPGTGKTTLMEVIADSLGMYFKKISLGGKKDPSEILGHSRTYSGSTPGILAKAQLEGGTKKVFYGFDEVEKVAGEEYLNALLPVFDKQLNFTDRYYNTKVDLSQAMFGLTTNEFAKLPEAFKNRVNVIHIDPYSPEVKQAIAKLKFEKGIAKNKLEGQVTYGDDLFKEIAGMANDQGGRQTTMLVDELIKKLKCSRQDGEKNIKIDKAYLEKIKLDESIRDAEKAEMHIRKRIF